MVCFIFYLLVCFLSFYSSPPLVLNTFLFSMFDNLISFTCPCGVMLMHYLMMSTRCTSDNGVGQAQHSYTYQNPSSTHTRTFLFAFLPFSFTLITNVVFMSILNNFELLSKFAWNVFPSVSSFFTLHTSS